MLYLGLLGQSQGASQQSPSSVWAFLYWVRNPSSSSIYVVLTLAVISR
jgi:hypothetical protein